MTGVAQATDDPLVMLEERGWAVFPSLEPDLVATLAAIARDVATASQADPAYNPARTYPERGLRWVYEIADRAVRRRLETRLREALAPWIVRTFPGHRAIAYNAGVKLAGLEQQPVRFHRDHAFIDERAGEAALQLWIPLVDVSPDNGGLIVVSGSHRLASPVRPLRVEETDPLAAHPVDDLPPGAQAPPLSSGSVLAFSNRTLHGSPPNRSSADRPAVTVGLVPIHAQVIEWVRVGDSVELWTLRDEDFPFIDRNAPPETSRLLETLPWPQPAPSTAGCPRPTTAPRLGSR